MAALYLHNALFSPESAADARPPYHTRNLSTVSGTTLHASASDYSHSHTHPTEPLLYPPTASTSLTLDYETPRAPPLTENLPEVAWDQALTLEGDPYTPSEKKVMWEMGARRRLKRLKWLKGALEGVIAIWAVYNTVMYFLAFTVYESSTGQAVSLALGMSTGIAFAFLICATVLAFFQPRLLALHVSLRRLLLARTILHYLASTCVLAPAIVNFAAVFIWRNAKDPAMNVGSRCRADIDVIWSAPGSGCTQSSPPWGIWVTVSGVRLALTLMILVFYHLTATSYHRTRRPSLSRKRHRRHQQHHRSESYHSALPPMAALSTTSFIPQVHRPSTGMTHHASETTLTSTGKHSQSASTSNNHSRLTRSFSAGGEEEEGEKTWAPQPEPVEDAPPAGDELTGFANQFRSIVNQIVRETEEALEFAQSEDSTSGHTGDPPFHPDHPEHSSHPPSYPHDPSSSHPYPPSYPSDSDEDDQDEEGEYVYRPPAPVLGYNEFGQPYPPEEHVRVLNGIIRRMPTIESMGSREVASSIGAGSLYSEGAWGAGGRGSLVGSRPPTRNTLLSWTGTGSEPPSRANSLTVRAGAIVGMGNGNGGEKGTSEVGELLGVIRGAGEEHSSTSGSRSTGASYFTATTGSVGSTETVEGYGGAGAQRVPSPVGLGQSGPPSPVGAAGQSEPKSRTSVGV